MTVKAETTIVRLGLASLLASGLAACVNTTPVAPMQSMGPPRAPVVASVPDVVIRDGETRDEISITKGLQGGDCGEGKRCVRTEIRNFNSDSKSEYVVSGDLRSRDQVEMYSDNARSGQQVSVAPGQLGGVVVDGVDQKSERYWTVVDPEGRDGPNFIAADPRNNNTYSITTEPDGHGDKSRQNDVATPGDWEVKSRIERARSGLPKKDKR